METFATNHHKLQKEKQYILTQAMFVTGCFFRRSMSHAIKPPQAQLSNQPRAVASGQLWSPWKLSVSVFFHKIVF